MPRLAEEPASHTPGPHPQQPPAPSSPSFPAQPAQAAPMGCCQAARRTGAARHLLHVHHVGPRQHLEDFDAHRQRRRVLPARVRDPQPHPAPVAGAGRAVEAGVWCRRAAAGDSCHCLLSAAPALACMLDAATHRHRRAFDAGCNRGQRRARGEARVAGHQIIPRLEQRRHVEACLAAAAGVVGGGGRAVQQQEGKQRCVCSCQSQPESQPRWSGSCTPRLTP